MMQPCPLCGSIAGATPFHRNTHPTAPRDYLRCRRCSLVFVPRHQHLDAAAEKAVYDDHENRPEDAGYRRFLARLAAPLIARLRAAGMAPGAEGLDFGCGPGPALARLFEEAGFRMRLYDPFYAPDEAALRQQYDFIAATEVFEHLAQPGEEIARLVRLLKPNGLLGVMTKRVIDADAFKRWHYIRDPTHVSFFSDATFEYIAARHGLTLEFISADVVAMGRSNRFN